MLKFFKKTIILILICYVVISPKLTLSKNIPDCEFLANVEEEKKDLPTGILSSISRVEAGRIQVDGAKKGWPWTINHAGEGMFFENKIDAMSYVNDSINRGDINLDVGCMQISIKWHSMNFNSLDDMFDPEKNISYAAKFLKHLYNTHGDWQVAIKHYHSADPRKNLKYLKKVLAVWSNSKKSTGNLISGLKMANINLPVSRPFQQVEKIENTPIKKFVNNSNIVLKSKKIILTKPKFLNERWSLVEKFRKEFSIK